MDSQALNSFLYILSNTKGGDLAFDENGKNALAIGQKVVDGKFNFLLKDINRVEVLRRPQVTPGRPRTLLTARRAGV